MTPTLRQRVLTLTPHAARALAAMYGTDTPTEPALLAYALRMYPDHTIYSRLYQLRTIDAANLLEHMLGVSAAQLLHKPPRTLHTIKPTKRKLFKQ